MTEPVSSAAVPMLVPRGEPTVGHLVRWLFTPVWLWEYALSYDDGVTAWSDLRLERASLDVHVYMLLLAWLLFLPVAAPLALSVWVWRRLKQRTHDALELEEFQREQRQLQLEAAAARVRDLLPPDDNNTSEAARRARREMLMLVEAVLASKMRR